MSSADDPSPRQLRRAEAIRHLPGVYSLALRLHDAGLADELIAECLTVERAALKPLFDVAEAKLAAILRGERA
ncbi:MAG TPA: hypothetical protein VGJ13_18795 [Pseudonocardiaceae bacterium]|jgi:hypothetical protein